MTASYRKWSVALVVLLAIALASSSCVKRAPLTTAQNVTLSLNQTLAAIATTNKAMAQDVIALASSGLIQKPLANSILSYNKAVAQVIITVEGIQRGSLTDADKAAAIKTALGVLKLPADVSALLQGPQGTTGIQGLVTTISSLQALIHAATGGK